MPWEGPAIAHHAYDRLSALDSSFLLMEDPNGYMHVASVGIFEAGPLALEGGGIDFEAIRARVEGILHRVPRYRQKLQWTPLTGSPVWVDDRGFNLNYHMRHTSLPYPGTLRQLKRLSARILSQQLDRSKPLWETWVVEGLEDGRFAIISKTHHCMVDGVSGVDLLAIMMSSTPDEEIPPPPAFLPRDTPTGWELLRDEALHRATLPVRALRDFREFARDAGDLRRELEMRARALAESSGWLRARSRTPFNAPIGGHRRYDWTAISIDEIRTIRKALNGSLNDVVLATVAGAVRAFLLSRGEVPEATDLRIMAPVSVRSEAERGALGNRVAAWLIELPVGEPDPRARVALIREQTQKLKESKQAVAADMLTQLADWTPVRLLSLGARRAKGFIPFNMVVTNVPGPQVPLYMVGAPLVECYPVVPITGDLGLGIALFSYCGRLFWGLNADWELLPDLHVFVEQIEDAFAELLAAAGAEAVREADPKQARQEEPAAAPAGGEI